ncbi:hypothetical protein [Pelagibacterium lacus]|uniref:Uncharacterized protein n=1 Tax=Pelagibacterium lacus TaxID=2282655 RepID=A0A369W3M8_9HYPH|nr:hypothetical protein [Pelagibacterium lacus]RDE08933.1 hypothetical protein DVH29_09290 [Pelagibacterium lacus]
MANAGKKMGNHPSGGQHGAKPGGKVAPGELPDEFDFADDIAGRNSLQGNDQENVHKERQAQAEATGETEGLIESFEKTQTQKEASAEKKKR